MSTRTRLSLLSVLAVLLVSTGLVGIFRDLVWFGPMLLAVLAVAAATWGARTLQLPKPLVPVAGLAALLVALTWVFLRDAAVAGVLPWRGAAGAAADLARAGVHDAQIYSAPVISTPGLRLLVAAGIGAVALVVDTLVVSLRRAVLAGIPLAAIYAVPAAIIQHGLGLLPFLLGAIGWLALLLGESRDRLSRWGRPLGYSAAEAAAARRYAPGASDPIGTIGRRVGVLALGVAVAVPAVLPTFDHTLFAGSGKGSGGGHGSGTRTVNVVNPIADLRHDLVQGQPVPLLRYTSTDSTPAYLRMVTLDDFDGDKWAPAVLSNIPSKQRVTSDIPLVPGLGSDVRTQRVTTKVQVFDLRQRWLPLPYGARKVAISGTWLYDIDTRNAFSTDTTTRGLTYTVTTDRPRPTPAQLAAAAPTTDYTSRDLSLPTLPPSVEALAKQVTDSGSTPYAKAVLLQNWLRSSAFTYTTDAPEGNGVSAIEAFLRDRRGFCVHFASTMAVMARLLGIQARVDVGFTPGTRQPDGSYVVTSRDAHAWPELYFAGVGWVPFEPTPGVRAAVVPDYAITAAIPATTPGLPIGGTTPSGPNALSHKLEQLSQAADGRDAVTAAPVHHGFTLPLVPLGIALAVLLVAAVPGGSRLLRSRRRWRRAQDASDIAEAAWAQVRDDARDLGYAWTDSETPRATAARLLEDGYLDDDAAASLVRLRTLVERARYARTVELPVAVRHDCAVARTGLARTAGSLARWRRALLPVSSLDLVRGIATRSADLLDALDAVGPAVRRRWGRGRPATGPSGG